MKHTEETDSFIRYVVRPEFLAIMLTIVGVIIAGGVAWGTLTSRVEVQERVNQAIWKAINDNKAEASLDHDQLTRIEERVISIQLSLTSKPEREQINKVHER